MNILFLYDAHTSTVSLQKAIDEINRQYSGAFRLNILRQQQIDGDKALFRQALELAEEADFIFIVAHGGITYFKKFNSFFNRFQPSKKFFFHSGISDEVNALLPKLNISAKDYATIYKYYEMGGQVNCKNLVLFLANAFSAKCYRYEKPVPPLWEGIYHPDKGPEQVWREVSKKTSARIAILFHAHCMTNNNLQHINALIRAIEQCGGTAFPIFTGVTNEPGMEKKGIDWVIKNYLMVDGQPVADVMINTIGLSMTVFDNAGCGDADNSVSVFEQLGIPVIQAFSTYFDYKKWKKSITGLDAMSLVSGIYMPEMDGQIGSYPIATHEYSEEYGTYIAHPIPDRLEKVAQMALNWANMSKKPAKDKKVAIIFHNMPPRNDMIGCAWGLDSPATVFNVIQRLRASGISTDYEFTNGDDIINRIIHAVSNDTTWKSIEDMLEESVDIIDAPMYKHWFKNLPKSVRIKLEEQWGKAPGTFMVHDGKLPIPGILNGNIFIGLQPPRAFDEKAEEAYHSTDIVCPHQYIAFYKWLKHMFKADFIIHIGTHGTLEWLPGKEKGLSNECYPDFTIQDIPHLYIYNISVVGEGIQAKRRSSAVILDHNIPSLTEGGTYNELAELDDLLQDYYHSFHINEAKLRTLRQDIWNFTVRLHLHRDLNLPGGEPPENFETFVSKLHAWVEKVKMSVIKDGLHIFGQVPEGDRFTNMLRQLVRIKNGEVMSINQGVAEALGYNYDEV
ncbi:MAG: cobaltochelatase subunit CobN, partial [Cytophagales bacterium]|nr:cobaltochelatase subunit CobN [Cytophagales bacterium]